MNLLDYQRLCRLIVLKLVLVGDTESLKKKGRNEQST